MPDNIPDVTKIIPDYITYPNKFKTYKWYKPFFVGILTAVFYFLGSIVNTILVFIIELITGSKTSVLSALAQGGYDSFDVYTSNSHSGKRCLDADRPYSGGQDR